MEEKIKEIFEYIRPQLQNDGGDVEFVSLEGSKVNVRLKGHCAGCAFSQMTVKNGIERILRENISQDLFVESVKDEEGQAEE